MKKTITEESRDLLSKKWFYWTIFVGLFVYAIMRAWTLIPMLDELATYYHYIRTGEYFVAEDPSDANNHVLNSFFGYQFFRLFGEHFFLYRLPSLLAFPIYFFSIKYIVQSSFSKSIRIIVFISLLCIPWLFEYFSYSRGYGLAIAFFFAAIAFIIKWKSHNNWKYFGAIFICIWFSIASSLTYLLPSLILLAYVGLMFILQKDFRKRKIFLYSLIILVWIAAITPFILHSFRLKEVGALWWGNQNGLWESTGKSLSRLVLFTDAIWVLYIILTLLLTCLILFLNRWIKSSFWSYLKETEAMFFILFIGTLTGIVSMRYVLDVNYPMDRVAMYLVPLFILFISLFLSKNKFLKYALLGLLFLPASFIYNLNLTTSIFSPEDRIPTSLTDQIKASIDDQSALSAEYVSHFSYAYSCRKDKKVHIAYTAENETDIFGDYHISWLGCAPLKGYSSITEHPLSKTCFMHRNHTVSKKLIVDTLIEETSFNYRYFTLLKRPIDSVLRNKSIQVQISGDLEFDQPSDAFNVVQTIQNENNARVSTSSPVFSWYFSERKDIDFVFTDQIIKLKPEGTKFNFFLYNDDLRNIKVNFIRVRIYQVMD
jgi:hypothetical protein